VEITACNQQAGLTDFNNVSCRAIKRAMVVNVIQYLIFIQNCQDQVMASWQHKKGDG
jgi:hypothetical protein